MTLYIRIENSLTFFIYVNRMDMTFYLRIQDGYDFIYKYAGWI